MRVSDILLRVIVNFVLSWTSSLEESSYKYEHTRYAYQNICIRYSSERLDSLNQQQKIDRPAYIYKNVKILLLW